MAPELIEVGLLIVDNEHFLGTVHAGQQVNGPHLPFPDLVKLVNGRFHHQSAPDAANTVIVEPLAHTRSMSMNAILIMVLPFCWHTAASSPLFSILYFVL